MIIQCPTPKDFNEKHIGQKLSLEANAIVFTNTVALNQFLFKGGSNVFLVGTAKISKHRICLSAYSK